MSEFWVWSLLWVLSFVDASWCVSALEYDDNYEDKHANEISQNNPGDDFQPTPCQDTRWDKLFIALENSQMRQNMLLGSLEQCGGAFASLKTQVDKLAKAPCQQRAPSLEAVCRRQAEQASLKLQRGLAELREEGAERERWLNSTLRRLLRSGREQNVQVKLREEGPRRSTPRPGVLGPTVSPGMKALPSGMNGPEVASSAGMASVEKALITIATELQKVQAQLNGLLERAG